jgi:hypothetical protein
MNRGVAGAGITPFQNYLRTGRPPPNPDDFSRLKFAASQKDPSDRILGTERSPIAILLTAWTKIDGPPTPLLDHRAMGCRLIDPFRKGRSHRWR